jgi:hypothetical protein
MKRFVPRFTYANVMATIAVFVALGGASYAAIKLPKNSVGSKQIKKNAITAAKVKNEAITPAKLNGASKAALTGPQGPQGAPGAPATALWAVIDHEGHVLHGTAISAYPTGVGTFWVKFGRDISGCAMVATPTEEGKTILARVLPADHTEVVVKIGAGSYEEFSLAVFC